MVGLFGWTWLAFLAALVLPYRLAVPLTVGVSALAAVALWYPCRRAWPGWRPLEGGRSGWVLWGLTSLGVTALLGTLFWTHSLPADSTGVYTAGATWGDFGLHAAIISHLAVFDRMPMDLPVASGAHLTYPFLVDLLSALYLREGWSLHLSLLLPGVLLALAICQLLLSVSLRLFGHVGAAVSGLVLFLLTGSAAGLPVAYADWRHGGQSLLGFLSHLPRDYTVLSAENGDVTNLVTDALLPQRAILFGFGVALTVLVLLHAARNTGERRYLLLGGVLIGLLPMAHPHTFITCGAVLVAFTVEAVLRQRRVPWSHLAAAGIALALAAPQLAWQQLANGGGTGGRFRLGWMVGGGESIWAFWWTNFGLTGILFITLPLLLLRPAWRHYLVWYLPFLGILAVTQVYAFQPFEYDNLKMIYYAYLMAGLFAGFLAVQAYRASRWSLVLLLPAALVVAVPGALSLTHEFQMRYQFADTADVALAGWVRANTAPDDVFIGTDRPTEPVATLGGRSIILGYRGWLFNFNLPYAQREAAVSAALQGRVDDPMVRRFAPGYLFVAANEDKSWTIDRNSLARLPVAYHNAEWTVYRLAAAR
ncbi:MAG: hypothetical protein JO063_06260 [Pseudonocardiales bacterium]|nr:hypothetical protein [Pseudonocardiales bacterium]MBV9031961.1 hypothetical protein [Pseudonocardiales bacterium]MBW0009707.1 hypothetical protein [Pseudonocardiales bacterium]